MVDLAPIVRKFGALGARATDALPMDQASRIARAGELGFRPSMPLQFGTAPEGEKIASAAINVNGRVFTGDSHFSAVMKAERDLGVPFEEMKHGPMVDGFVTDSGRFVSRYEAGHVAGSPQQGALGLHSDEGFLNPRSIATASGRTGATAPGLPGGRGVWGVLGSEGDPASTLWHRAERPAVMDASGAQSHEIQATLADAWDRGHDAVMLKNYTRPGGETPENVIVVKDANQLRSPNAAFDPTQKSSRNLLAGITGLGVAVGVGAAPTSSRAEDMPETATPTDLTPQQRALIAQAVKEGRLTGTQATDATGLPKALARLLAPNITSALSGEPRAAPPPDITGAQPGKVPSSADPRIAGSVPEMANLAASVAIPGIGALGGAAMRGGAEAIPALASRLASRAAPAMADVSSQDLAGIMGAASNLAPSTAEAAPRLTRDQQRQIEMQRQQQALQEQQAQTAAERERQAALDRSTQEIAAQRAKTQADIDAKAAQTKAGIDAQAAQAQAAREENLRQQNLPFREKYGPLTQALPGIGAAWALGLPIVARMLKIPGQNAIIKQWEATADEAQHAATTGDHAMLTTALNQLEAYGNQWAKSNKMSPAVYAGAAGGPAEAALTPSVADVLNLPTNDPNQPDWSQLAGHRLPVALGEGAMLASGSKFVPKRTPPIVARSEGLLASYPDRAPLEIGPPQEPPQPKQPAQLLLTPAETKHFSANEGALTSAVPSAQLSGDSLRFDPDHTGHLVDWINRSRVDKEAGTRLPPSFYPGKVNKLVGRIEGAPANYDVVPYKPPGLDPNSPAIIPDN
ncbi:MAG: hypothetical protein EPO02_13325 [Nitrospirae bacterium]|nr:MAG: hypothetical protein EPO02_13325 [Nitrospirota bacterium]